jgi:hypothetical protein
MNEPVYQIDAGNGNELMSLPTKHVLPKPSSDELSPILVAARDGDMKRFHELFAESCSINVPDGDANTCIHYATMASTTNTDSKRLDGQGSCTGPHSPNLHPPCEASTLTRAAPSFGST